ncbi:MAG: hypothetical protein IPM83_11545 [Ignavibacteria bacterium]|nr:hypothetical protein [Ignavibacteria bacterium]
MEKKAVNKRARSVGVFLRLITLKHGHRAPFSGVDTALHYASQVQDDAFSNSEASSVQRILNLTRSLRCHVHGNQA